MRKTKTTTAWQLSTALKRAELQRIATQIGAPVSGTKPQLMTGINDILTETQKSSEATKAKNAAHTSAQELRVLSIDMGIRNLAFAFLTCQVKGPSTRKSDATFSRPELRQWQRTELFDFEKTFKAKSNVETALTQLEIDTKISSATLNESFEPSNLAKHAYKFSKYCASLRPTHILIERQRFRSAGHAAVQEWSLRVGMLEAMFHSTFRAFREEGILARTNVESILPIRVNNFWFDDQEQLLADSYREGVILRDGKKSDKVAKINIVHEMLQKVDTKDASFSTHTEVKALINAFKSKASKEFGRLRGTKSLEKLDDVSDSLLQGLAWLRWQENRLKLLTSSSTEEVD